MSIQTRSRAGVVKDADEKIACIFSRSFKFYLLR